MANRLIKNTCTHNMRKTSHNYFINVQSKNMRHPTISPIVTKDNNWHTPTFLERFKCESKNENGERIRSWVCFLTCNTLRVEGHDGAPRWGLGKVTSKSIIHMNLHKPNNKLVNAGLEHFWCTNKSWTYMDSQDSSRPGLRGSHHLPPYNIFCAWPWGLTQISFCPRSPKIPKIRTLTTLGPHNFFCRPLIEVRFKAKL